MIRYTPDAKRGRALPLQGNIIRLVQPLAASSVANARSDPEEATAFCPEVSEDAVAQFIQAWRKRGSYLPSELFSDPAWGMLLELLQAEIQDRRVSLARLSKVSALPTRSAMRWLKALERQQLAVRRADPQDPDNPFVELSQKGSSALRGYFHDIVQSNRSFEDEC